MKILMVRHAEAEPLQEGRTDAERMLTSKGHAQLMRRVSDIRAYFSMQGEVTLWSSDYVRAKETAQYFADGLPGVEWKTYKFLRKNKYDKLLHRLKELKGDAVLIVGHNPMLDEWIEALTGETVHLKKMEAVCIEWTGEQASILWKWTEDGRVSVRPYAQMLQASNRWLEECAFALHADIIHSRFAFQRTGEAAGEDQETQRMCAFLSLLEPVLPEKRRVRALDRYLAAAEKTKEFFWLRRMVEDVEQRGEGLTALHAYLRLMEEAEAARVCQEILSYDSQKGYHKAFRSLIKGLREIRPNPLFANESEGQRCLEKQQAHWRNRAQQELKALNAEETDALFEVVRHWEVAPCAEQLALRFFGQAASFVPTASEQAWEEALFALYRTQGLLRYLGRRLEKRLATQTDLTSAGAHYEALLRADWEHAVERLQALQAAESPRDA